MEKNIKKSIRKGFTLLEILLVIGAIGILASIVIVAINPLRQIAKVRNSERQSEIGQIYKAIEQYYIAEGKYPQDIEDMQVGLKEICDTGKSSMEPTVGYCDNKVDLSGLVPTYIAEIPSDSGIGDIVRVELLYKVAQAVNGETGYRVVKKVNNTSIAVISIKAEIGEYIAAGIDKEELSGMITNVAVEGTNNLGEELSVKIGGNTPGTEYNYQWMRDGIEIEGATGTSYTITVEDLGKEITVDVTVLGVVLGGTGDTPSQILAPTVGISGGTNLGDTLTATASFGTGYGYQWKRDGVDIVGANNGTYEIVGGDLGTEITVELKIGATVVNTSIASNIAVPTVSISGGTNVGDTLTATPSGGTGYGYQWMRDGVSISGATNNTYTTIIADGGKSITVELMVGGVSIATGVISNSLAIIQNTDPLANNNVLYLKFNNNLIDSSPNNFNMTAFQYGYTFGGNYVAGKYGSALRSGLDFAFISGTNPAQALVTGNNNDPFTIESWVRFEGTHSATSNLYLADILGTDYNGFQFMSGKLTYALGINYRKIQMSSAMTWNANTWYHVAVVKSDLNNYKLFVNGVLQNATYSTNANFNTDRLRQIRAAYVYSANSSNDEIFIDSLRVSNVARYTSNFNPETDTGLQY